MAYRVPRRGEPLQELITEFDHSPSRWLAPPARWAGLYEFQLGATGSSGRSDGGLFFFFSHSPENIASSHSLHREANLNLESQTLTGPRAPPISVGWEAFSEKGWSHRKKWSPWLILDTHGENYFTNLLCNYFL